MPFTAAMTGFHRSLLLGPRLSPGSSNMKGVVPDPMCTASSPPSGVGRRRARGPDATRAGSLGQGLGAVDAGAERLVPGAGEHHHADVVVTPEPAPQAAQLALHGGVEGVHDVGTVEGDPRHAPRLLVAERLELGHRLPRRGRRARPSDVPGGAAGTVAGAVDGGHAGARPITLGAARSGGARRSVQLRVVAGGIFGTVPVLATDREKQRATKLPTS